MSALCALRLRTNEEVVEETDGPDTLLLQILSASLRDSNVWA
jgi:hypothetical protein